MFRIGLKSLLGLAVVATLSACQHVPEAMHQPEPNKPLHVKQIKLAHDLSKESLVSLHCSGGAGCEFAKLNNMVIVEESTKQPSAEALKATVVRYEYKLADSMPNTQYYIAMRPGTHEVKVRFYPITWDRAETFTLIHAFAANRDYSLNMFRERAKVSASSGGSLLSVATPDPLCIQLLENEKIVRRFCRPFNPTTGLGEFVEQKISGS